MVEDFRVVPAVDIEDGRAVQLVGGERGTETTYGDPVEAAERWVEAGARRLHVIDLDGAFDGERANADAIAAIVDRVDIPVQVGGGIRERSDAVRLLEAGVDRVILGTAAIETPALVDNLAAEFPDGVMVSLDASAGEVVVEGWTQGTGLDPVEAASSFAERGAAAILFTDVDTEGRMDGIRADRVRALVDAVDAPVVASGGVASIEDVRELAATNAAGVVVGTALYEGQFSLSDAQNAVQRS
ncbi:MAG: 1-(5-phosphoribosyl)-5-[(5-phosphoribosylamino)methylideneamino]imidazole-4-carboxamide isomerase [Halococcoides sp.]